LEYKTIWLIRRKKEISQANRFLDFQSIIRGDNMYLMMTVSYPANKADEVVKKFVEVEEKYPQEDRIASSVFPGGVYSDDDGVNTVTITDVPEGKMADAINSSYKIMNEFRNIEGYKYKIRPLLSIEEAMATL
jgi:hypothetical protein